MKLLGGSNENENADSGNRQQLRNDEAAAVYGPFNPSQESEFPAAFVPKRWPGTEDMVEVV